MKGVVASIPAVIAIALHTGGALGKLFALIAGFYATAAVFVFVVLGITLYQGRLIDALGGAMARATDRAGIHFRTLNGSKGPAVRATRAQADRSLYRRAVRAALEAIARVRRDAQLAAGRGGRVQFVDDRRNAVAGVRFHPAIDLRY